MDLADTVKQYYFIRSNYPAAYPFPESERHCIAALRLMYSQKYIFSNESCFNEKLALIFICTSYESTRLNMKAEFF